MSTKFPTAAERDSVARAFWIATNGPWVSGHGFTPGGTPWGTSHEAAHRGECLDRADSILSALAPFIAAREAAARRAGAVEALREAADDMNARNNTPQLVEAADRWSRYYAGIRTAMGHAESVLRTRSDQRTYFGTIIDTDFDEK